MTGKLAWSTPKTEVVEVKKVDEVADLDVAFTSLCTYSTTDLDAGDDPDRR
jgi:hypothetical protein